MTAPSFKPAPAVVPGDVVRFEAFDPKVVDRVWINTTGNVVIATRDGYTFTRAADDYVRIES